MKSIYSVFVFMLTLSYFAKANDKYPDHLLPCESIYSTGPYEKKIYGSIEKYAPEVMVWKIPWVIRIITADSGLPKHNSTVLTLYKNDLEYYLEFIKIPSEAEAKNNEKEERFKKNIDPEIVDRLQKIFLSVVNETKYCPLIKGLNCMNSGMVYFAFDPYMGSVFAGAQPIDYYQKGKMHALYEVTTVLEKYSIWNDQDISSLTASLEKLEKLFSSKR